MTALAPTDIRKNPILSFTISLLSVFATSRIGGDLHLVFFGFLFFLFLFFFCGFFFFFFFGVRKEEEINQIKNWKKYLNKLLEEKSGVVENLLDSYLQASTVAK